MSNAFAGYIVKQSGTIFDDSVSNEASDQIRTLREGPRDLSAAPAEEL